MSSKRTAIDYPMGSVSCSTMRPEDLIPTFLYELQGLSRGKRNGHAALCRDIAKRMYTEGYYRMDDSDYDLDALFDALGEYAAPYFYFGAHPGDGADYGFWLSESWDDEFESADEWDASNSAGDWHIKVSDLAEVPARYRGEVAVVNDHGNVTLYVKTSRALRLVWEVV